MDENQTPNQAPIGTPATQANPQPQGAVAPPGVDNFSQPVQPQPQTQQPTVPQATQPQTPSVEASQFQNPSPGFSSQPSYTPTPPTQITAPPPFIGVQPEMKFEASGGGKSKTALWVILGIIVIGVILVGGYMFASSGLSGTPSETPTSLSTPPGEGATTTPTPTATPNPTAGWLSYKNDAYGYTIKYPKDLKTQALTAGGKEIEAEPDSTSFYIYHEDTKESYLERHLSVEFLKTSPAYTKADEKIKTTINDIKATKVVIESSDFDIYLIELPSEAGFVEVYVAKADDKKELAIDILNTFRLVAPTPTPKGTPTPTPNE